MTTRKRYRHAFKVEAVGRWQTSATSAQAVERELGMSSGLRYKWCEKLGRQSVAPGEASSAQAVRRRQREVELVKPERDSLKKAGAIDSPVQPCRFSSSLTL